MSDRSNTWRGVPLSKRLALHPRSSRSGSDVRALAGASDWRRDLLDRFGSGIVSLLGARHLAPTGPPSWPRPSWDEIDDELRVELPGLQLIGAVTPRQSGRPRLSLLGRMTGSLVVIKLGRTDGGLDPEREALELLARDPLPGISTPEPLGAGTIGDGDSAAAFLVTTAIALHRQRAAIDEPLRSFEADLGMRLGELPRTTVTREHDARRDGLVPVHGDLTPWNLRRTPRGLALFDWESAGWGRPGSDLACYRSASDEIRRPWSRSSKAPDMSGALETEAAS